MGIFCVRPGKASDGETISDLSPPNKSKIDEIILRCVVVVVVVVVAGWCKDDGRILPLLRGVNAREVVVDNVAASVNSMLLAAVIFIVVGKVGIGIPEGQC